MPRNYIIYARAREKLESACLAAKVQKAHKEDKIGIQSFVSADEVVSYVKEMQQDGYFKALKEIYPEEHKSFTQGLQNAFKEIKSRKWKVERHEGPAEREVEADDFLVLSGWWASCILTPKQLWQYKKHGFSSPSDFVGSLGAFVNETTHLNSFERNYEWKTTLPDGREFISTVTGNIHLDLRIERTDVTPYKTLDPCGAEVSYRPVLHEDLGIVAASHSSEPSFLAGLLKYAEQTGLESELLADKGKKILEFSSSLGQSAGNATECLFDQRDDFHTRLLPFYAPLPVISEDGSVDEEWGSCHGLKKVSTRFKR